MAHRAATLMGLLGFLFAVGLLTPLSSSADPSATDPAARGKYLVRAGDCVACHTAPGGKMFAGGYILKTPFGSMSTPNITPDPETGIGKWTDAQFYTAMHDGIGHDGEYLYPMFPFPWYTKVTREDVQAIKAYLFTQPPVKAKPSVNHLAFPFDVREGLGAWRLAFFHAGTFEPDPNKSEQINRGAYLVEGLGHCAECHSGRVVLGASKYSEALEGGSVQGWYAPNITSDKREGIGGWTDDQLVSYLKTGSAREKGVAVGPMAETIHDSLQYLTDGDLHAIAAFLKSTPAKSYEAASGKTANASFKETGEQTYLNYCASCHQLKGKGIAGVIPALAGDGAVTAGGPENVIRVVIGGLAARGTYAPMPGFGADMTDDEIASVANYVRSAWSNTAPDNAAPGLVAKLRTQTPVPLSGSGPECPVVGPGGEPNAAKPITFKSDISSQLQNIDDANLLDQVHDIIPIAKTAYPQMSRADLVNNLTNDYCTIVSKAEGISLQQKRWRLHRFGQAVYGELRPH